MLVMEKSVRDLVNRDLDCADLSIRLMAMRAKWEPVRAKKTRQNKDLKPSSDSIGAEKAFDARLWSRGKRVRAG
jgi:hypothetical protein